LADRAVVGSNGQKGEQTPRRCPKADKAVNGGISQIVFNLLLSMEASG
jgi:hypothetical protein